jgi:tRNA(fMet)-specific endonuclease VapC
MRKAGVSGPATVALDTSAYAQLRAGHPQVHRMLGAAEAVCLPVLVLGELEAGFRLGRRPDENRRTLTEFLEEPFVRVIPVTPAVARRYGQLFSELRRAGTPISINDVWIAACALEVGAHLLTFDTDFDRIPHLDRTVLTARR